MLAAIDQSFGSIARPDQMCMNPRHCEECEEHEQTLQGVTPDTVSLKEVGSPGWDPMCFASGITYQYFLPGLSRLALGIEDDYYLGQFLFHLDTEKTDGFNADQKRAVLDFLKFVRETMLEEADRNMHAADLVLTIDKLGTLDKQNPRRLA